VSLPLILAGPILRRVEPNLVSVWVALSEESSVKLSLWEGGQIKPGDREPLITGPEPAIKTLRIGNQLHIVVVVLKLTSDKVIIPGRIYSYDLTFQTSSETHTLKSLGLLKDDPSNDIDHLTNIKNLALGYEPDVLPSFASCPPELTDLRIVHGSCRRTTFESQDGLAWVDDLFSVDNSYKDPLKRPHQLFLTGDQIYADDVSRSQLYMMIEKGAELIGKQGKGGNPISEQFVVNGQLKEIVVNGKPKNDGQDEDFLPGRRLDNLILNEAKMTSSDGHSHLISFAEFCSMYLFVWSNAIWPEKFPEVNDFLTPAEIEDNELLKQKDEAYQKNEIARLIETRRTLPKVRRALANVPTYMIFDDHDVTDDWYLNPIWRDRVLTSPLGRTIIRNGLLSYALFQGWGNDPVKFESGDYKRLLELATQLFPADAEFWPNQVVGNEIDTLFGLDKRGGLDDTNPPLKWHYSVPGIKHQVIVLDNRTRRSYVSRLGPPGNVSLTAQSEQIPQAPTETDKKKEVLFVVSSLPVLGAPMLDELIAPLSYRAFDLFGFSEMQKNKGTKGMTGTNPDAIEAWAFDPKTLEALLRKLEPYRQVIILSGDVHYGASNAMSYWKKGVAEPARFAQFISSGMQNVMPDYIRFVDRSLAFAQRIARSEKIGAERIGWDSRNPDPLLLPVGVKVVPALRSKLKKLPVMIPTEGWPSGTEINQFNMPDWQWHLEPVVDYRKDEERPKAAQPTSLYPEDISKKNDDIENDTDIASYRRVAIRHSRQLERRNNSRQILFASNIGVVRFEKNPEGNTLIAVHELYTTHPDPDDTLNQRPKPQIYTLHKIPLRQISQEKPEEKLKPKKSKEVGNG
jgi:hypothetical protein